MEKNTKKRLFSRNVLVIWALFVTAFIFAIGFVGFSAWSKYKNSIIGNQEQQMLIIVESLSDSLEESMRGYSNDVLRLGAMLEYNEEKDRSDSLQQALMEEYLTNGSEFVQALVLYHRDGSVAWGSDEIAFTKTYDTTDMGESIRMKERLGEDGAIYFTLQKKLAYGDTLMIAIDVESYYKNMISDIHLGTNGYVMVKNEAGIIFMHPEKEQIGIDVIQGRKQLYGDLDLTSLEEMVDEQNENASGISEYYSYWWMDQSLPRVKKISAYSHADIGDGFLVISAVMDYSDVYQPVLNGIAAVTLAFVLILIVFLVFLGALMYFMVQRQKNKEEIEYLKDLNRILEETKQGELAIAHQQKLQIMGTMTGGIAHEFNNLLAPIMGYSELLMDSLPETSDEYDFANEIFQASDKAKDIIRQIAGLSRKNMETVFTFVPIRKAFRRSLKMVRSACPANIRLEDENSFKEEGYLGNETQLNQVILNICINAFHAIGKEKEGMVYVTGKVVTRKEVEDKLSLKVPDVWRGFLMIRIKDNGCGMEPEVLEQVFNPFFTTKQSGQGTGLGLSVAEQIIHSHRGYLFAESTPGVGSIFYIYLPEAEEKAAQQVASSENARSALRILVIDDNEKVLRLLERRFHKLGITITAVNNTNEAREKLEQEQFHVLLIDQQLSKGSGDDSGLCFALAIKNAYPGLIKIIMTDQIRKEIIEAKQHGYIDSYMEKPISDTNILEEIHKISHR